MFFYFSSGQAFAGIIYNIWDMRKNYKTNGKIWPDQNIIIDGKWSGRNLLGFILFCITFFLTQVSAIESLFCAVYANINTGVITIIWRSSVFMAALADYIIFGQKLKYYHFIGLISCVTCTVLIALSKVVTPDAKGDKKEVEVLFPAWVPILLAIIMAVMLTTNTMQVKHLTTERVGFDSTRVTFNGLFVNSILVFLLGLLPYLSNHVA